ncbi:MAG: COQ9 family protein [Hyphomonas sp.]|nr:COQ9 family protein [Hyphomonas sp.]
MSTPSEKLRDRWLDALLPEVEQTGWTVGAMRRSAAAADLTDGERALAAPNGVTDLIDHFFERSTDQMLITLARQDLDALRTHERVAAGLQAWLDALGSNKAAVRKAAGRGLAPWGAGAAVKRIWAIADAIWEAAGDQATDYNRQTKRALLSAVIPSIVLRWLDTDNPDEMQAFIERRLQQAMTVGKTGGKLVSPVLDFAEKVRARTKPRDL